MMDLYILYQSVIWRELCDENPRYESRARETMEGACKRHTERMEKVKPKGTRELPAYLAVVTVEVVYVCVDIMCVEGGDGVESERSRARW